MTEQPRNGVSTPGPQQKTIDQRFDEVDVAFAEMRDFTTFCFDKLGRDLRQEIKGSEGRVTRRLDRQELVLSEILAEVKALRPR